MTNFRKMNRQIRAYRDFIRRNFRSPKDGEIPWCFMYCGATKVTCVFFMKKRRQSMESETIELLLQFGLTRPEAKIYFLLLREGPFSGYEAAKRTGISRSNAYAALAALVDKGAAYIMEEQAVQYLAVDIEEFCDNKIHFLKKTAAELVESVPRQKSRNENYITIHGRRNVEDKFRHMLTQTQERVYLAVSSDIIDLFREELVLLVSQGKKVVLITETEYDLPGAIIYRRSEVNTQIRLITDSMKALTGEMQDRWQTTCLYSENPNLVRLLKEALAYEIRLIQMERPQEEEIEL